jgi:hypothetical protein
MTPRHKGFLSAYVRDPGSLQKNSEDSGARALRGGKTDLEQRIEGGPPIKNPRGRFPDQETRQERPTSEDTGRPLVTPRRLASRAIWAAVDAVDYSRHRKLEDIMADVNRAYHPKPYRLHKTKKRSLAQRSTDAKARRDEAWITRLNRTPVDMLGVQQYLGLKGLTVRQRRDQEAIDKRKLDDEKWQRFIDKRNLPGPGDEPLDDEKWQRFIDKRNLPYDPLGVGVAGGAL